MTKIVRRVATLARAWANSRISHALNVAFVGTKTLRRPQELSRSVQGYHWNTNAETDYLVGQAMGEAMKRLLATK